MYDRFYPGKVWLDTEGKRIQAHGGSILVVDGVYYWYGENKDHTVPGGDVWTWGVRCYRSTDLYNWEDLGLIIPPELDNAESPLNPCTSKLDRPHILYNAQTKKFVCWVKVMSDRGQRSTVLTADDVTGPYTVVHESFRPLGMDAGDFDLVAAEDGKAYYYFERVHSETICADLTEDYTDVTGYYSTHFPHHEGIPHVREATAHFQRGAKHYLVTSGTTGYYPNPSEIAVGDTWHGPFTVLGDPHPEDPTRTSFHTQISSVFHVPGTDLYIALGDRWLPKLTDFRYADILRMTDVLKAPDKHTQAERDAVLQKLQESRLLEDTAIADYVWLPISFSEAVPTVHWLEEWRWEDYKA